MSDTTAFLSGCVITGLAAVGLFWGGFELDQTRSQPVESIPTLPEFPNALPVPSAPPSLLDDSVSSVQIERLLERQRVTIEDLENKVEKQQSESEELRTQLERQQESTRQLISQLQEQQHFINTLAARQNSLAAPSDKGVQFQTFMMWVMGGVILVVVLVGAVVLVGVIFILVQSQRRPSRVVPPYQEPPLRTTYALPQPVLLSPAQPRKRRTVNRKT
jgi:hypothetical protein